MIFEAPIMKPNETVSVEELEKLDGKELNVPLVDTPGSTDMKNVIGVCKRLFWRDEELWAEFELFKFNISVGFKKPNLDITETVLMKEPLVPLPRNIDYAKD